MTYLSAYVGDLEDPRFQWGAVKESHQPRALTPEFPDGHRAWHLVHGFIDAGIWQATQIDWGAWAARVQGKEVLAIVSELYGPPSRDSD